jgi:hypothetical protein
MKLGIEMILFFSFFLSFVNKRLLPVQKIHYKKQTIDKKDVGKISSFFSINVSLSLSLLPKIP